MIDLQELNLNAAGDRLQWEIDRFAPDYGTFHVEPHPDSSWGTAVITVQRSNDGEHFHALESATTLTTAGMSAKIDLRGIRYIALTVTTAEGSASRANVVFYANRYGS